MGLAVTGVKRQLRRGITLVVGVALFGFPTPAVNAHQPRTRSAGNSKAATVSPSKDPNATLSEAADLLKAGKLDDAEALVRRVVTGTPRDPNAHVLLGVILDQKGRPVEAEAEYREALRLEPNNISALANLGVLLAHTKRIDQAIETLEAVLRIQPTQAQAVFNLGTLYAARGDYQQAIPLLERASAWSAHNLRSSALVDVALLLTLVN